MKNFRQKSVIIIPAGRDPWPHEMRVAEILSLAGHRVEFLEETNIHTADILLDGVEYEIKSPEGGKTRTIERAIKKALKQSHNLIIDTSRMKGCRDDSIRKVLLFQARSRKQIRHFLMITKHGQIIDISAMV